MEPDGDAGERLFSTVYQELRGLARRRMLGAAGDWSLEPTGLVHEVYLKLRDAGTFRDRQHFMAVAALAMRQIVASHARERAAQKRGGGQLRVTFTSSIEGDEVLAAEIAALDAALTELEALSPRQARVVEYRFFAGLSVPEVAELLGCSDTTVEKEWRRARAWLGAALR